MTEYEEFRVCPHCGFRDVPTLIVKKATSAQPGIGWRCHACLGDWTDEDLRFHRAS
jgi:formate dehydrogenase maturation protein FdhE